MIFPIVTKPRNCDFFAVSFMRKKIHEHLVGKSENPNDPALVGRGSVACPRASRGHRHENWGKLGY